MAVNSIRFLHWRKGDSGQQRCGSTYVYWEVNMLTIKEHGI